MERLLLWPASPLLSALAVYCITQLLFFPARQSIHRLLLSVARSIGGGLRLTARWLQSTAAMARARNREVLLESGRAEMERKIEQQFQRLQQGFSKDLRHYPELHQKLNGLVTRMEEDFLTTRSVPPEAPGWPTAVKAVTDVPEVGERASRKILLEIKRAAVESEKLALREYRNSTTRRHNILAALAPSWKQANTHAENMYALVSHALGFVTRIDAHMERYEKLRQGDVASERLLASSALTSLIIALLAVGVACAGAFLNFHLIALPMSELVPSGTRIVGVPLASVAALVVVLMEATAGLFVMEALGVTEMFPQFARLGADKRRVILVVAGVSLFCLACIESSLAVLREQIVDADLLLKQKLAASDVPAAATSSIPVIGQALLGFILPWLLAVVALPLQLLIQSGRHVFGRSVVAGISLAALLSRVVAHAVLHLVNAVTAAFDVYIAIPLQLEKLVRRPKNPPVTVEPVRMEDDEPAPRLMELPPPLRQRAARRHGSMS